MMHAGYWSVTSGSVASNACHLATHGCHQKSLGVTGFAVTNGFAIDYVLLRCEEGTEKPSWLRKLLNAVATL